MVGAGQREDIEKRDNSQIWGAHAHADLAREPAGARADLGDGEAALPLVLAHDRKQVADVAAVEALHERVRRVQHAVLRVLHDRLDRVLRACGT